MNFLSFVGNDEVKKRLGDYFINGRLPHFIILQGEEGTGKRTLGKLIASAAVCRSDAFSAPCGKCPACIRAKAGTHPDIKTVTGSGASGMISTESIKNLIEDAYLRPEESEFSVYLLFAGNIMSEATQNKLLKIIEEPPPGVMFILCIKSAESLLPTVRSRAGIFTLKAPSKEEAAGFLKAEYPECDESVLMDAIESFSGNIGKIKAFIEDKGKEGASSPALEAAVKITALLTKSDEHSLLKVFHPFIKDKQRLNLLINNLSEIFRDASACKFGSDKLISVDRDGARKLCQTLTARQLMLLPEICRKYSELLSKNANQALLVTAFCSELRKAAGK
ncbi:MAG: hypothetical protein J6M16_03770 [Clostridia bacterium]|nr:hypothetical protein [Clostridia bacterium]